MKNLLLFPILFLLLCTNLFAQAEVEKSFRVSNDQALDLNLSFAKDIKVDTWDKNEVQIIARVKMGDKNTSDGFEIDVDKNRNKHVVKTSLDYSKVPTVTLKPDEDGNINFDGSGSLIGYRNGEWKAVVYDLTYEIKMPEYLTLTICANKGNVEIKGVNAPLKVSTNDGFIDIARRSSDQANVELSTTSGEIFSDFENIVYKDKKVNKKRDTCSPTTIKAALNGGGGDDIVLSSKCGNIYLRKL